MYSASSNYKTLHKGVYSAVALKKSKITSVLTVCKAGTWYDLSHQYTKKCHISVFYMNCIHNCNLHTRR